MTKIEDLAKESFGSDCTVEPNAQFLSVYQGEIKMAVINTTQHRMILSSPDFLDNANRFSEAYKQAQGVNNFLIFASYL